MEFPEYAAKYSKEAIESRKQFPANLRATLDEIENGLLDNPDAYGNRVIPVSRNGTSFLYLHLDPAIQVTYEVDTEDKIIYFFHYSAPSMDVQKSLFISYSHKDEEWLQKVRKYLTVLEQQGVLNFWDDSKLEAGKPWHEQILQALDSAEAGVLLVSQDFLTSNFIKNTELPKLLDDVKKKGKSVYWIHLSPSTVFETHKEITMFQSLQKDPTETLKELSEADQEKALVRISKKLSEAVALH